MRNQDQCYRVLVTGSRGIIGGHLLKSFGSDPEFIEVVQFQGDLTNFAETQATIKRAGQVDGIIHLAAMVSVDSVQADPERAYAINVGGTINLLRAVKESGQSPHVFCCSSAHVYAPQTCAISENSTTKPTSLYGRTKLMAEIAAQDICGSHDIPLCIGRVFSIHDPAQIGTFLRPNIMKRLSSEDLTKPFELFGADSIRDFLTAEKAAQIIGQLARARYSGVINIGSGLPTRIRDFVQDLSPRKLDIRHLGRQDCLLADTKRLNSFLEGRHV